MTNREWLNTLSDEELAKTLNLFCPNICVTAIISDSLYPFNEEFCNQHKPCENCLATWLRAIHTTCFDVDGLPINVSVRCENNQLMTNREWLTQMTDEELITFLFEMSDSCPVPNYKNCDDQYETCEECFAAWFKAEHKEVK